MKVGSKGKKDKSVKGIRGEKKYTCDEKIRKNT